MWRSARLALTFACVSAALLFSHSHSNATTYEINLNFPGGVPGTGFNGLGFGSCYCATTIDYSNVYLFQAGDVIDFGQVLLSTKQYFSGPSPPYTNNYGIGGVSVSFDALKLPPKPPYDWVNIVAECPESGPGAAQCSATSAAFTVLYSLVYTIPDGASSIQIAWSGAFDYIPPVPLPATLPLFASGLGALGLLGWRRKRKA
jgi:PEP-CTERM motif